MSRNGKYSGATTIRDLERLSPRLHTEVKRLFQQCDAANWFSFSGDITVNEVRKWCAKVAGATAFFDRHFGGDAQPAAPRENQATYKPPIRRQSEQPLSTKPVRDKPVAVAEDAKPLIAPVAEKPVAREPLTPIQIAQMILLNIGPLVTTAPATESQAMPFKNLAKHMFDCGMKKEVTDMLKAYGITITKSGKLKSGKSDALEIRQCDLYKIMRELVTLAETHDPNRPVLPSRRARGVPAPQSTG